jgi:hypothetical protein
VGGQGTDPAAGLALGLASGLAAGLMASPPKWSGRGRPLGQATRGKTRAGRLRSVDAFCALYARDLLARRDGPWREAPFVDLGFGASPDTCLESAATFRRLNPQLRVLGVEIDRQRVEDAQWAASGRTEFRLGGFNLPLNRDASGEIQGTCLVRAFNVLRQYDPDAVPAAWEAMGAGLLPGGLLIEGTSDPEGRIWCANLLRRRDKPSGSSGSLRHEGLIFYLRPNAEFEPEAFQAVLPKQLIHRVRAGEPIADFFEAWKLVARMASPARVWGPLAHFRESALGLRRMGFAVDPRRRWLMRGYVIWRHP